MSETVAFLVCWGVSVLSAATVVVFILRYRLESKD